MSPLWARRKNDSVSSGISPKKLDGGLTLKNTNSDT